jgi:Outer membrane protein beta-barrel domain
MRNALFAAMRSFSFLFLAAASLYAQDDKPYSLSAGFKLGSALNDPSSQSTLSSTYSQSRWTGGPTIEFHLPFQFAIEFDALYRNYRTNSSYSFQLGQQVNPYSVTSLTKANVWDFPLMLKKSFTVKSLRPFISAGYQWSDEYRDNSYLYSCSGLPDSCQPTGYPLSIRGGGTKYSVVIGNVVAGAGLAFKTRYGTISPEVRFSRPVDSSPRDSRVTGLVGFSWGHK